MGVVVVVVVVKMKMDMIRSTNKGSGESVESILAAHWVNQACKNS